MSKNFKQQAEQLKKYIRQLEKSNKNLVKKNEEMGQVIEIQKGLMKEYAPKIDRDKIKKQKNTQNCCMSMFKLLNYLGFPKSTFYHKPVKKELNNTTKILLENIRYVGAKNRCVYGREKLLVALNKHLSCLNLELTTDSKLRRLMKLSGISSQLKKKNRYKEGKNTSVSYPNLIKRKFKPNKPYEKLFTDVAYFKTPSGNLYVSVIIDTFDNKVLSGSISTINDNTLVMSVLNKIRVNISKAIIHSDHGCQYSSHEYQGGLKQNDCTCSMSRVGNSLDNYPIEHHFSFLKQECLRAISGDNRTILNISNELKLYYKGFNEERVQTCLNYRTPNQVHGMIYNNSRKVVQL